MTAKQTIAYLKYGAKSLWAFLGLIATNIAMLWVTDRQPLPQTRDEWITFAVTTIGGSWLVWRQTNGPKPQPRSRRRKRKPATSPLPPPDGPTHDPQRRPTL